MASRAGREAAGAAARARSAWGVARAGGQAEVHRPFRAARPPDPWGPKLIVLGLLVPIAFGRWGSYISPVGGPVYLSDLLVAGGLGVAALEAVGDRRSSWLPGARRFPWVIGLVLGVCAIGFAQMNFNVGQILRDIVPILYFLLIPASVWAVRSLGAATSFTWLRRALGIHAIWALPVFLGVLPEVNVPLVGTPVFSTRLDYDSLMCAAAVAAYALDHRMRPGPRFTMLTISALGLMFAGNRAGLFAALLLMLVALLVMRPFRGTRTLPVLIGLGLMVVVPFVIALPALLAQLATWIPGLAKLVPSNDPAYSAGQGTWNARLEAWGLLLEYSAENPVRLLLGSGFGSDPIIESGAIAHLSGDHAVRATHNFTLTWLAYFGVLGTALLLTLLAGLFTLAIRNARQPAAPVAWGLGMMSGLVVTASAGVIFETPYGCQTLLIATGLALLRPQDLYGRAGLERPKASEAAGDVHALSRWRGAASAGSGQPNAGERARRHGHPWMVE